MSGSPDHSQPNGSTKAGSMRAFRATSSGYVAHGVRDYPLLTRIMYAIILALVYAFVQLVWRPRIEGEDAFVAHAHENVRGSVIVMNHVSMIEPVVVITRLWRHGLRVRAIYKSEFDQFPPASFLFPRLGGIPIVRDSADLSALRAARDALARGEYVLVFPEGTRIKSDEQQAEIHGGFAMIAQMADADVVPMAVVGARKSTRFCIRRPTIGIGEPIAFDDLEATARRARLAMMERIAMERVYDVRAHLRADHPGLW